MNAPLLLEINIDQIELLDDNPRTIADEDFAKLVIDIRDDPAFLIQRPPLINKTEGRLIAYAGNQRIRACKHLGYSKVYAFVEEDVPVETQRRRTILDNTHRGKWDMDVLANSWGDLPLNDWGIDISQDWLTPPTEAAPAEPEVDENVLKKEYDTYLNNSIKQVVLYFEGAEYEDVINRLDNAGQELGAADNSETVRLLLDFYFTRNTAQDPAPDAPLD